MLLTYIQYCGKSIKKAPILVYHGILHTYVFSENDNLYVPVSFQGTKGANGPDGQDGTPGDKGQKGDVGAIGAKGKEVWQSNYSILLIMMAKQMQTLFLWVVFFHRVSKALQVLKARREIREVPVQLEIKERRWVHLCTYSEAVQVKFNAHEP